MLTGLIGHTAIACESGNPQANTYMRRDNNRCEGIRPRADVSGSIALISFTTHHQGSVGSTLPIYVPKISNTIPNVLVRALDFRYQLDQIQFQSDQTTYEFTLPTTVLTRAGIPFMDLRATAIMDSGARVYVPVMLQDSSDTYRFVFYSTHSVRFIEANIRPLAGGSAVASWGEQNARRGEKVFEWSDPASAPAGRYEFSYSADIEQRSRPAERLNRSIVFEHNPDWLN